MVPKYTEYVELIHAVFKNVQFIEKFVLID